MHAASRNTIVFPYRMFHITSPFPLFLQKTRQGDQALFFCQTAKTKERHCSFFLPDGKNKRTGACSPIKFIISTVFTFSSICSVLLLVFCKNLHGVRLQQPCVQVVRHAHHGPAGPGPSQNRRRAPLPHRPAFEGARLTERPALSASMARARLTGAAARPTARTGWCMVCASKPRAANACSACSQLHGHASNTLPTAESPWISLSS